MTVRCGGAPGADAGRPLQKCIIWSRSETSMMQPQTRVAGENKQEIYIVLSKQIMRVDQQRWHLLTGKVSTVSSDRNSSSTSSRAYCIQSMS